MSDLDDALALAELRRSMKMGEAQALREAARLSQAEAARATGVSRSAVSSWETGRRAPRGDLALRYCAFLRALSEIQRDTVGAG